MAHDTKTLQPPWKAEGDTVEVDLRIVPLIEALWEKMYWTLNSCEGGHDHNSGDLNLRGYVQFYAGIDGHRALDVFREYGVKVLELEHHYEHRIEIPGQTDVIRFQLRHDQVIEKVTGGYWK